MTKLSYLRHMDESDLDTVHHIEKSAYDFPWSRQGFEKSLDQGLNYVFCSTGDSVLGYCCILPVLDEAHILNVCVSPKHQRKGVARQALQQVLSKLNDASYKVALLEVRESNLAARKLYAEFGFSEDGVRKGYYRAQEWSEAEHKMIDVKEDAVLMSFSLTE